MLKDTKLAPNFPMHTLVGITEGASGSDLKEMCRHAAMVPVREYMRDHLSSPDQMAKVDAMDVSLEAFDHSNIKLNLRYFALQGFKVRPLELDDFLRSEAGVTALPTSVQTIKGLVLEDRRRIDDLPDPVPVGRRDGVHNLEPEPLDD
jgi:SpoVK/Ycf46/Vps4 family AAA+-type ATPase